MWWCVAQMAISAQTYLGVGQLEDSSASNASAASASSAAPSPASAPASASGSGSAPASAAGSAVGSGEAQRVVDPTQFVVGHRVSIARPAIDELVGSAEEVETISGEYIGVGTFVFALDQRKVAVPTLITEVRGSELRFHFLGRESKFDEWVHNKTSRITSIVGHPFQSTVFHPPFRTEHAAGTIVALAPARYCSHITSHVTYLYSIAHILVSAVVWWCGVQSSSAAPRLSASGG
jgi:hypothetical protein